MGNLSFKTDEYAIEEFFHGFGSIKDVRISYDKQGHSNGFAHIEFENSEEAYEAMDSLDGLELDGRLVRLEIASSIGKVGRHVANDKKERKDKFGAWRQYGKPEEEEEGNYEEKEV